MAKKNKRIYTILGAAVGTGLAVYGIRQGMRWYQRRQSPHAFDLPLPETNWSTDRGYQPVQQFTPEPIPATGPVSAPPPVSVTEMYSSATTETPAMPGTVGIWEETSPSTGSISGGRMPMETTSYPSSLQSDMETTSYASSPQSDIVMDDFVAPLIEHAIAFNSVMNLLRSRQRDGEGFEGTESLTEGDRGSMRAVLAQMQEHVGDHDEATLRGSPLALRSYQLTRKLQDALDNLNYTGSDLYRIQREVGQELCTLTRELEASGQVTITGLDHIRQLYEC